MKNNVVGRVFIVISIVVGSGIVLLCTHYINDYFFEQGYAYWTREILTIVSSGASGVVAGVIFYGLTYWIPKKIIEKINNKE